MKKEITHLFWLLIFCFSAAFTQTPYSISGTIKDKDGAIPGASVYISGYKKNTSSTANGSFLLADLAPGNYDILVQMIGYLPYAKNIVVNNQSVKIEITLKENITLLNEVVVKPDPNRLAHIQLFKKYFIGETPNAAQCVFLNPSVLQIDDDKKNSLLSIKSNAFLILENKALGYRLKYLLQYFEYNYKTNVIYYAGFPYFEELKGSKAKQKKWQKNRLNAYNGSLQHLFKSLYNNTVNQQGFSILKIAAIPNTNRKPDSLINAQIKKLTSGNLGTHTKLTFTAGDSLNYWLKQRKEPLQLNVINRQEVQIDTLVKIYNNDLKQLNYTDALYIVYKKEVETEAYLNSGYFLNRPKDLTNYQISIIELTAAPAYFYANGGVLNTKSFLYKGFLAYEKIGDMIPLDFIPQK